MSSNILGIQFIIAGNTMPPSAYSSQSLLFSNCLAHAGPHRCPPCTERHSSLLGRTSPNDCHDHAGHPDCQSTNSKSPNHSDHSVDPKDRDNANDSVDGDPNVSVNPDGRSN